MKTTSPFVKFLLLAIAGGIWANALLPFLHPASVEAQSKAATPSLTFRGIREDLDAIDIRSRIADRSLQEIKTELSDINSTLDEVRDSASDAADVRGDVSDLDTKISNLASDIEDVRKYTASVANGTCPGKNYTCQLAH